MTEPTPESTGAGFSRRVARGFLITGLGSVASKLLNVAALFLVLKLISPEELGLASIVLAVFSVLQSVTELGLGVALVQAKAPTRRQIDSLFWLSLAVSGGIYLVVLAGAPLVGWIYEEPELVPLLRVQGLAVLIASLSLISRNLLVRELAFGRIAIADNASLVASSGVMIACAAYGYGAWALIAGDVAMKVGQLVLCQAFRPYLPRLGVRLAEVRGMVRFGLYATGSRLLYNVYIGSDYLVVGKVFGSAAVGVYTLAYRIVADPIKTLASVVNQVAYPAFARLQDQPERLRSYFFTIARANLSLIGVVVVLVCVHVEDALLVAGYTQWLEAVPLVRVIALSSLFLCVAPLVPQLLNAVGQARLNFFYSAAASVFMPAAFYAGSRFGLMGVAWAWALAYPVLVMVLFRFGARALGVGLGAFVVRSMAGLVVLLPVGLVAVGNRLALGAWTELPPLALGLLGVSVTLAVAFVVIVRRERETLAIVLRRKRRS